MNPNEIFTYPLNNNTDAANSARKNYFCRFLNNTCDKLSRTIDYPMGVCSVNHSGSKPIICPHRFLEDKLVFQNACLDAFGSIDNVLLFSEIKIPLVGIFDFVLVKHEPLSSNIVDFCIVEFQSDSTTGTGKLVNALRDFMSGTDILEQRYKFGMNTYNTIKLSYIQMLIKGQVMEKWEKKIYWVMQKFVFENMVRRFGLINLDESDTNFTRYHIYDLALNDTNTYKLNLIEKKSTTIANLLRAFTHQPTPSKEEFIVLLQNKINMELGLLITT